MISWSSALREASGKPPLLVRITRRGGEQSMSSESLTLTHPRLIQPPKAIHIDVDLQSLQSLRVFAHL
jgi:hypothetical protein